MIFIQQPGIRNIVHEQTVASTDWVISHNFTNAPVLAIDTMIVVEGQLQTAIPHDVIYQDAYTIVVKWLHPRTGFARLG